MDGYVIDSRSSRFTVQAFATGLLAKMGHNPTIGIRDFSGEMKFNPEKLEAGGFRMVIKSASLSVQDDISDKDLREIERLMKAEVLETEKISGDSLRGFQHLGYEDGRYALFGHAQRKADHAWRHAQSADCRASRSTREYATGFR